MDRLLLQPVIVGARADLDEIAARRNEAHAVLAQNLDKRRFMHALLGTAIWIEGGEWLTDASADAVSARDKDVGKLARKALARTLAQGLRSKEPFWE